MPGTLSLQNGVPEIRPLTSLSELLEWRPDEDEVRFCRANQPYQPHPKDALQANRPRFLCCHDMHGGYLEDRLLQGGSDSNGYVFRHWNVIDGFVYFSHKMVTVPPPGWINAAHLHGVPVLGTFITEWEAGAAICASLLRADAIIERAAHQLASIAAHVGFDGWIVNIENEIALENIPKLLYFLTCLTNAMHAAVPSSKVIWYDAVTVEGRLDWQNALTRLNLPFFEACDGIWLNYTWKESTPGNVRAAAGDRQHDVYMGIDAFGRGTFGGGGLDCKVAVATAQHAGLSVALFACAWPFEQSLKDAKQPITGSDPTPAEAITSAGSNWEQLDHLFWSLILEAWGRRRPIPRRLPMYSNFCSGVGYFYAQHGDVLWPQAWYNISLQSLQPHLMFIGKKSHSHITAEVTNTAAFSGSNSILVEGSLSAPVTLQLYRTHLSVPSPGLRVRFVAAASKGVVLRLSLKLRERHDAGSNAKTPKEFALELGNEGPSGAPLLPGAAVKNASQALQVIPAQNRNADKEKCPSWIVYEYAISPSELPKWAVQNGATIVSVEMLALPKVVGAACQCTVYVGELGIRSLESGSRSLPKVMDLTVTGVELMPKPNAKGDQCFTLTASLRWKLAEEVFNSHVYIRIGTGAVENQGIHWGEAVFVGFATTEGYYLHDVTLPPNAAVVRVYVATTKLTAVQSIREAASVVVQLGPLHSKLPLAS